VSTSRPRETNAQNTLNAQNTPLTFAALSEVLERAGIRLSLSPDGEHIRACPASVLTPELTEAIRRYRAEIRAGCCEICKVFTYGPWIRCPRHDPFGPDYVPEGPDLERGFSGSPPQVTLPTVLQTLPLDPSEPSKFGIFGHSPQGDAPATGRCDPFGDKP